MASGLGTQQSSTKSWGVLLAERKGQCPVSPLADFLDGCQHRPAFTPWALKMQRKEGLEVPEV